MNDIATDVLTVLEIASVCEAGPVRGHNEDSIVIREEKEHGRAGKGTLLVVADGLGGMEDGEVASVIATCEVASLYLESEIPNVTQCLVESVAETNLRVYKAGEKSRGIGTTIVASAIVNEYIITVNVGDSRAYLFRNGVLKQLSMDHSLRKNPLNAFERNGQDLSHVLTQALGPYPTVEPHVNLSRLASGDVILLCSDGLTSVLADDELENVLAETEFSQLTSELLERVYAARGDDNISIIVGQVLEVAKSRAAPSDAL